MRQNTLKTYILLFIAALTACESDVDFRGKEPNPKLIMNSIIEVSAEHHNLKLSESVFVFGNTTPRLVDNATLSLKVNGQEQVLTHTTDIDNHRYYNYTYNFKAGDKIEISGNTPQHETVTATDYIPNPPEIKELVTGWFKNNEKSFLSTFITIKDPAAENNFYRIVIRSKSVFPHNGLAPEDVPWDLSNVYVDKEILFNNISGIGGESDNAHKYRVFSDELFQGKEYTLNVYIEMDREDGWGGNPRRFVRVELQSLSQNLFMYYRSLELASSQDNFSEPVKIFTNMNGGYGILGAYNVYAQEKELEL